MQLKTFAILGFLLFLVSCGIRIPQIAKGTPKVSKGLFYEAPELKSYAENFIAIANTCYNIPAKYRQLRVRFTSHIPATEGGAQPIAVCSWSTDGLAEIEFLKSYYDTMDHTAIRRVMFHEMGHCYMRLNHSTTEDPNSIMAPTMWANGVYDNYDEYYLDEMFGKQNDCNMQQFNEDIMNDPYVDEPA